MCLEICNFDLKILIYLQIYQKSFFLCIPFKICSLKHYFSPHCSPQILHLNGSCGRWQLMCTACIASSLNITSQHSHFSSDDVEYANCVWVADDVMFLVTGTSGCSKTPILWILVACFSYLTASLFFTLASTAASITWRCLFKSRGPFLAGLFENSDWLLR